MKILVTGGTGFIGSHLAQALISEGHEVTTLSRSGNFAFTLPVDVVSSIRVVKGDVSDADLFASLLAGQDILVHNASAVGAQASIATGAEFLNSNVGGANTLARVLTRGEHHLKQIILGSSISVYGEGNHNCAACGIVRPAIRKMEDVAAGWNPRCPVCRATVEPVATPESAATNGEHLYAVTKKYQEEILTLAAKTLNLPLTIFRYATVFGVGQKPTNPYMQMLRLLVAGDAPVIFEDGLQTRDFINVSDVVRANLLAIKHRLPDVNTYNIGSGNTLSLLDYMERMIVHLERSVGQKLKAPIVKFELNQGDVRHCNIDCSKASEYLGFTAESDIDLGLEQVVDWSLKSTVMTATSLPQTFLSA